jgi:hypothetical protein
LLPSVHSSSRPSLQTDIVDIAARIADSCEDGKLRSLLNGTREYALLVEGDTS